MIRLMFLGDRRIAWRALRLILEPRFSQAISLEAVVTDDEIWSRYSREHQSGAARFVTCRARQTDTIRRLIVGRKIDVLLSVQYNWILPSDILDLVEGRAFNLHNGRLPEYKGYNAISHAILNGDTIHHSTLHWMAPKVDSGDIAYVGETAILAGDTALSLYLRSVEAAIGALVRLLDDFASGRTPPRRKMSAGEGRFYPRDSVRRIADVTAVKDPEAIERIARAAYFPPVNTAWMSVNGTRLLILPESAAPVFTSMRPANLPEPEMELTT